MPKPAPKVLIVEDDQPAAVTLELKLQRAGLRTETAPDGELAIDLLSKKRYDLILLDLVMPKKDGFQVLQWLSDHGDNTPVIVDSNLSQEQDLQRALALGATSYFVKANTTLANLVGAIRRTLGFRNGNGKSSAKGNGRTEKKPARAKRGR